MSDAETILSGLLERGYFPKELPPTFTTVAFAKAAMATSPPLNGLADSTPTTLPGIYNFARVGTLRRPLSIVNPISYAPLARDIAENWDTLVAHAHRSTLTATPLEFDTSGLRSVKARPKEAAVMRARSRAAARTLLTADISRFYPSVYTHSIPWALHGKAKAKADHSAALLGNQLDKGVRNGQDAQTLGLPIGPDTSFILAEVLQASLDALIVERMPELRGMRVWDDYELAFSSRGQAEVGLGHLQAALSHYGLALNPDKTRIQALPVPIETVWLDELRNYVVRTPAREQANDLIGLFDLAATLAPQFPDKNVLRYCVTKFEGSEIERSNWPLFQHLLLQAMVAEPGTARPALAQMQRYIAAGARLDRETATAAVNLRLGEHASVGHSSEVAWSLWACLAFDLVIAPAAATAISEMDDSVVALLALDAESRGLVKNLNKSKWLAHMTEEALYGEQWLLAYEANCKGWLPSVDGRDHVKEREAFRWMRESGVTFYDPNGVLPASEVVAVYE